MVVTNVLLQPFIVASCSALEQFVKGAKSNFDHTFTMTIPKIGKFKGIRIPIKIRKTRATVTFQIRGLPKQRFEIGDISTSCVIVVNAALAVA